MTNPDYTAIMLLIDRSGSMESIRKAAQAGINDFIAGQVTTEGQGRRTIRIAQFDFTYETVCTSRDPASIEPYQLSPRGGTALLDAMGRSIVDFGDELAAMPEDQRPATVILAAMTDGHENSSREYTWPRVKAMVERQQREFSWQVLYLGANQDAIEVGAKLGVPAHQSMTYAATDDGTRSVTRSMTAYTAAASAGAHAAFTDAQRDEATK